MTDELPRRIGARARAARLERGISQAALAEALNISQAAVSNLETGQRSPRVDELARLAELVGRDLDYFLAPPQSSEPRLAVTFRAIEADLPMPELRRGMARFLDEIEHHPPPAIQVEVQARQPEPAAHEARLAAGQLRPPINVQEVARTLGIALHFWPFPDALSAFLLREHAVIGVNSNQSAVRQRFSAAHEIGHFALRHEADNYIDYGVSATSDGDPPGYDWGSEREANRFAAELLMPTELVRADASGTSLARLAKRYAVSQEAMSFRLLNLGLRG